MKTIRNTIIVLACGIAAVAAAQSNTKAAITALYAKMDTLTLKRDADGLKKFMTASMTKDCSFIDVDGSKKDASMVMMQLIAQIKMMSKVSKSTTHIDSFTEKGGTVVAVTTAALVCTAKEGDGKLHTYAVDTKGEDTWVKSGGAWKIKVSKNTKQTTTRDGKKVTGG